MNWPRSGRENISRFYGEPDPGHTGQPSRKWEDENLTYITPPWRMVLAWDTSREARHIRVHKKCAESLSRILDRIWEHYGSQEAIEQARMHLLGGCHNFRQMRGSSSLSTHSWGCAIDLDTDNNTFGKTYRPNTGMMPLKVVEIFMDEGWAWGGLWAKGDAMHFQAVQSSSGQDISALYRGDASRQLIVQVQLALITKGYHEVGNPDGDYGRKTRGAILAFEADNELPLTGEVTADIWEAINQAKPREIGVLRASGKPADNQAVKAAEGQVVIAGGAAATGVIAGAGELLKQVEPLAETAQGFAGVFEPLTEFVLAYWPLLLVVGAGFVMWGAWQSRKSTIDDFRTGKISR